MERVFYKVVDKDCELYQKLDQFLTKEKELIDFQEQEIKKRVPAYTAGHGYYGWDRVPHYDGFVFENPQDIDPKIWVTKNDGGNMLSTPNKRTKAGREMIEFLGHFKRTSFFDVEELLGVSSMFNGKFCTPQAYKKEDAIYITMDDRCREQFEKGNKSFIEITIGEYKKVFNIK